MNEGRNVKGQGEGLTSSVGFTALGREELNSKFLRKSSWESGSNVSRAVMGNGEGEA